jgi:hypothetical protein
LPLTPEEEAQVEQGEVADFLLGSDAFRMMVRNFEAHCATEFFNTDVTEKAEIIGPELQRARLTYLGFRAFIEHLNTLRTTKQELEQLAAMREAHNGDSL